MKQSKPLLAKLNEDYPKIRTVANNEGLINYLINLINIKATTDAEIKDLQVQMIVILDFIKSKFGQLTEEEIKEAFKMYVAKDFGHKEIYRTLDTIVVSDVLNKFLDYRSQVLRSYDQKQKIQKLENMSNISEAEANKIMVEAVNNKYLEFLELGTISEPIEHIFKELIDRKILKMPTAETPKISEYYDKKLSEAKEQIKKELEATEATSVKEKNKIKIELDFIIQNTSSKVEIRAKKLVLIDYFTKQKQLDIKTILTT